MSKRDLDMGTPDTGDSKRVRTRSRGDQPAISDMWRKIKDASGEKPEEGLVFKECPAMDEPTTPPAAVSPTTKIPADKVSAASSSDLKYSPPAEVSQNDEQALRAFDLNLRFGPCVGPSRMQRWLRAERLGLEPPPCVAELLKGRLSEPCNWSGWQRFSQL